MQNLYSYYLGQGGGELVIAETRRKFKWNFNSLVETEIEKRPRNWESRHKIQKKST